MQSLDIISVNFWQILISLCNLVILFLILKKLLFKPVKKVLADREDTLRKQYEKADAALESASQMEQQWEEKMSEADAKADAILQNATETAQRRSRSMLEETQRKADGLMRQAEHDAELERKKALADIKKEIVDVSAALSEKMIRRELKVEDHRQLIDDFLSDIGEEE